jgi:Hydrazine synthase alpha subunit middle domain
MNRRSHISLLFLCATSPAFLTSGCGESSAQNDLGVRSIAFIKRAHTVTGADGVTSVNVAGGNGQVLDYQRYVPGGSLVVLSPPRPDGEAKNLTKEFPEADFNGLDVAFDATQIVFSMKKNPSDHYHLYTAQLSGANELHQLTAGNYDDINPVYIPGDKIAFVTNQAYTEMGTRADEYEHSREATQLATITKLGGDADRRLGAQNLSHTVAPFLRSDGRIGYSRWEHLGPINDVKLFSCAPDLTDMQAVAGQHNGKPSTALFSVTESEPNVMIGIATARNRTIHAGALLRIDARNSKDPVCMDPKANQSGRPCLDEENTKYENLTPDVPTGNGPSPVGRYRTPSILPDGRILVSYAEGSVNDLAEQSVTPPDFGIYVFDAKSKKNQLVYNTRDFWEVGAKPIFVRKEPQVIADKVAQGVDPSTPTRLGSIDVTRTSLGDTVTGAQFMNTPLSEALGQASKVRIIEGFSSEGSPGVSMFGLTMDEGAAILGEATVYGDKSWLADIPPYVPVHLQPIDKFGLSIRNQRLWIQGAPGEDKRCLGCHEERTGAGSAKTGQSTIAEQTGAQAFTAPIVGRTELPWVQAVQPILDQKCVQCHDGGASDPFAGKNYTLTRTDTVTGKTTTYTIPYLKLTPEPIQVVYDRRTASYATSYVSLFYPAAMEMGMGKTTIAGDRAPLWAVPTNARGSKMVEKLNVKASDGTLAFAGKPQHPEDKGVNLTDSERAALIQSIDLGGQYFARKGSSFVPNASDPLGAKKYP